MYTIGQFAKKTGMTVRALRFYDEKGLLHPSHRSESGRKYYDDQDLVVLQNILTLKFLGYSLDHIQELMASRHVGLYQSLLLQKQEMVRKKEQLEKTIATLDHALALAEKEEDIHTDIFLSLIHGLMMEDEQKAFLKTVLPEPLVHDIYNFSNDQIVEHNRRFMEHATKLRSAYYEQLPDEEVIPIIEQMLAIIPNDLVDRMVETSWEMDAELELDESLFLSPFTKEEEAWLMSVIEKMEIVKRGEHNEK